MTALPSIAARIAQELGVREAQVTATIVLLDEGATVPFVARYRKEVTGGLDDTQLRTLDERLIYLRELEDRRAAIIKSIDEQGKLTPELAAQIVTADSKARLEDLYLPYKQKRRTKAQIARENGLEPLADALLGDPNLSPEAEAAKFITEAVADVKAALDGARQILMERMAEDADLLAALRDLLWDKGVVFSTLAEGMAEKGAKFSDYFDYREAIKVIPSHRALALFRGRNENVLNLKLLPGDEAATPEGQVFKGPGECELKIARAFNVADRGRAADAWLVETVRWAWRVKIHLHLELELTGRLREAAEEEAISVFARNLRALLLQAPAGLRPTLGLDPGIRTGVKVAVVDQTGKVVDTNTVYPFPPKQDVMGSLLTLAALCRKHKVELVAIGNGTASRETERLVVELMKRHPELNLQKLVVSEAGASVYSASELAAKEFPGLDVSLRGAVSIARRLQDPLAELVKIDPKSIGVGQYQHDVNQSRLGRQLDAVVEDCVNAVGVEVNTASAPLLARVAGLSPAVAANIVAFRDANGPFDSRSGLKQVDRLGPKAFEQAAGFLRVANGNNPLDASAVHPEAYDVVKRMATATGRDLAAMIGDVTFLRGLKAAQFTDDRFGEPTIKDILKELEKPGRDPRPEFKTASFKDGVETMQDLQPGMILEGVVTNVTNFGAFVDIGVHQDGLVHVSALADRFVKDPHEVVKPGDVVSVKVLEVDLKRKRIALTMRKNDAPAPARPQEQQRDARPAPKARMEAKPAGNGGGGLGGGAFAEAFARAKKKG
ncbi:Tex family protein [Magnetospirillum gryphiswaldense]|uniref:Small ribosomal subunit protein bS1 n=1 Tax=Magnetospirillum gryphiswaldense TaxID=55518 RepID=A4TUT2_9PROT|nr:Tex family protein [Magnetospirillum gryphiswaldense]AVM74665.1 30S ribosomal protein S1 [Magnetospirillum gryphiswaldense MSR-1]AVM78568.1 30S ribosomal protein S1 [Magnetospirillum gryphiswaldense]CAM74389.1 Transcriptional accessory protein [Magnetospirillum gryphiswaldense MSR-1]